MVASDLSSIGEIGLRMGLAGPVESPATASHHFAAMRKPCRQPQGHRCTSRSRAFCSCANPSRSLPICTPRCDTLIPLIVSVIRIFLLSTLSFDPFFRKIYFHFPFLFPPFSFFKFLLSFRGNENLRRFD